MVERSDETRKNRIWADLIRIKYAEAVRVREQVASTVTNTYILAIAWYQCLVPAFLRYLISTNRSPNSDSHK